jgi:hypothetical protein
LIASIIEKSSCAQAAGRDPCTKVTLASKTGVMKKVREQKHGDELQSHLLSNANQLTAFERQENQIHISNWDQVLSVIADGAPLVARWHKQFIRRLTPQAAALTGAEIDANFDYFKTQDYRIGYDAFINKTKPAFKGR